MTTLTNEQVEQLKGHGLNRAAIAFVQHMCKATADGIAQVIADAIRELGGEIDKPLNAQAARIKQLEQQVALLQNALAQSGQKFVLPADEHQPLSFTTTRRA